MKIEMDLDRIDWMDGFGIEMPILKVLVQLEREIEWKEQDERAKLQKMTKFL